MSCSCRLNSTVAHFMPPGTAATGGIRNLGIVIIDKRSTTGNGWTNDCLMDESKFQELLSWSPDGWSHDTPGPGVPADTLFDSIMVTGTEWTKVEGGTKEFASDPLNFTNQTDWQEYLSLQVAMGVENIERAATNISRYLPINGPHPKVILTIPYPDPGQHERMGLPERLPQGPWGEIDGRSINISLPADRLAACTWFIDQAIERVESLGLNRTTLTGFYWVAEHIERFRFSHLWDEQLLQGVAAHIHARGLIFVWIPYYHASGWESWRDWGFDFMTMQPNWAFCNGSCADVSSAERFAQLASDARTHNFGIEVRRCTHERHPLPLFHPATLSPFAPD